MAQTMIRILRTALCIIAACALVKAQTISGKITGVVTDPASLPVADAAVQVTNVGTGETWRVVTNLSGVYVVSQLPVGDYAIEVRKSGFKVFARKGLRIDVLSFLTIDVQLDVGSVAESVTVDAPAPTIETETSDVGDSRYAVQLANLPVVVREVQTLVGQTAGVPYGVQSTVGGTWKTEGKTAMQITADGVQVNPFQSEAWPSIGGIGRRADLTIPGVEVLSEVKFTLNGGSAEYMEPTQVIAATKSGTNQLHGSLFELYGSGGLGARRWENTIRDSFVRHQAGGSAGGAIKKNKMFFFVGFEAYRYTDQAESQARYPTAAERSGDLSDMLQRTTATGAAAPVRLFDPLSGGQLFPNNLIPASRISPVSVQMLTLIPAGPAPVGNLANYNVNFWKPQYDNSNKYDGRFDYEISSRDRVFVRATIAGLNQQFAYNGDVNGPYGMSGKVEDTEAAVLNWTHIVNPSTIVVFQSTFRSMPFNNSTSPQSNIDFSVAISGTTPQASPWAGPPSIAIQSNALGIGGPTPLVTGQTAPTYLLDRSWGKQSDDYAYTFDPTLTKVLGNHTFKAGFSFLRGYKTSWPAAPPFPLYTTVSDYNNANSTTSATGDAFADFLLGYPSTSDVAVGPPQQAGGALSKTNVSAYLEDAWKVTSRLTLNLGIRYDKLGFFEEMNKRSANGSFALGKILIQDGSQSNIQSIYQPYLSLFVPASQAGLPSTFVPPNNHDFVPRFGFAYRLTPTFVVRGGFGIYNVDITTNVFGSTYGVPPFVDRYTLTRAQLLSSGINVNSVYTFLNPTANGSGAGAVTALTSYVGPLATYPTQKNYTFNLSLEKDLGHQVGLRLSYTGNDGRNLARVVEVNACAQGPVQCTSRAATDPTGRKWTQFSATLGDDNTDGQSEYNAVGVEIQKRFASGMFVDVNYTYARLFAYADPATNPVSNPLSHYDWGPIADQPNNVFHWNFVYDFPFGRGRRFGSSMNRIADAFVGGWNLSGLGTWQTGPALTITTGTGQSPSGATTNRADLVGDPNVAHPTVSEWFNTAAFAQPALVDPTVKSGTYMFGSAPIGVLRGPEFFSTDMTLRKDFTVHENWKLQVRILCFNPFNMPMYGSPDTSVSSATFGRIRTSYASYNAAYGARAIQLGLRLEF